MRAISGYLLLIAWFGLSGFNFSATTATIKPVPVNIIEEFEKAEATSTEKKQESSTPAALDADLEKVRAAEAAYHVFEFDNRKENLRWQLLTSKVIFLLVCVIVLTGVGLAVFQF
jgi:hypothetical protein